MKCTWAWVAGLASLLSVLVVSSSEAEAQRVYVRGGVYGPRAAVRGRVYVGPRRVYGRGGVYYGPRRVYGVAPRVYGGGVYGPRVYVTGPVLAPPVVYGPAPVVVAPAPVVVAPAPPPPPPVYVAASAPPPVRFHTASQWGLGVRGLFVGESASKAGGVGGHLRWRGGRWFGFEISADYLNVTVAKTTRHDVPVMAAMLLYLSPGRFAPYLLGGAGVNFATTNFNNGLKDSAQQISAQVGGGLELRLGRHIGLTADLRYIYRERLGEVPANVTIPNIGTEHGAQLLVGGTWYF